MRVVVDERLLGQPGPVEAAVGADDVGSEPLHQALQHRRSGLDDLAGDHVGVDDDGAPLASRAATVDFPDPMPPVSPIICTAAESTEPGGRRASEAARTPSASFPAGDADIDHMGRTTYAPQRGDAGP